MDDRYVLSGVEVNSNLCMTRLLPCRGGDVAAALRIRMEATPRAAPPSEWKDTRTAGEGGPPWLSVARWARGYLLRIHGLCDFTLDTHAAEIVCHPTGDCPPDTLEHLILDQIFPLALHALGRFSFHASSVAIPGFGVVAFLGNSGLGKSTLAASLARTSAATLFSDDCLAVAPTGPAVLAHPSYPSARLWPPSAKALFHDWTELPLASARTDKRRAALPAERAPQPLRRIYLLEPGDGTPTITPLRRRDALSALAAHLYRLDFEDRARLVEELALLEQVVIHAAVARLSYRRDFAEISAVHAVIQRDMEPSPIGQGKAAPRAEGPGALS
jgi:hypothetical protein